MDSAYIDYLVGLDSGRSDGDLDWIEEQTESRFYWEREDACFRNVQVLG